MLSPLACLALTPFIAWLIVLLLPWQPWRNREVLENLFETPDAPDELSDVSVVIPARDEAAIISNTLTALARQAHNLHVILVDDCSTDATAEIASQVPGLSLSIIAGEPKPAGWAGKLWALEQGVQQVRTRYTLLLDADIHLAPGTIQALKALSVTRSRPFISVMAALPMAGFWEKLLMPAFIYFFKMLYPFALANGPWRNFTSAAGGCIFMETRLFESSGGLSSIRDALIDDCALAKQVKQAGFRTWTGQSLLVRCVRPYTGLGELWNMVARSAYTQLGYSFLLLLLCSAILLALFEAPLLVLLVPDRFARYLGAFAWVAMALTYLPTLFFYRRSPTWVLAMPLIGLLYLGMTWTSALRYWRGERSRWKDRSYARLDSVAPQ